MARDNQSCQAALLQDVDEKVAMACVAALFNSYSFVAPRQASIPAAAITAAVAPAAAQAAVDMPEIDMGSSLNLSATVEALMLGIVMGSTVPITVFGLFVSVAMACVAALFNSYSFVAPRQASIPAAAITAAVAPAAAQAAVDMPEIDMGSSLNLSATVEALMLGIVMGSTVPITVFGLFVSAWLQFKKGPTLGTCHRDGRLPSPASAECSSILPCEASSCQPGERARSLAAAFDFFVSYPLPLAGLRARVVCS
ncbi:hypothetical protein AK812_SmicGene38596 [Symbiodinium microadriaticum]|uniref:Uncharacterized protein n=1 Tax=Symbiodinium microadriaticum TaxID=2951 RepID=A0A1Q9CDC0_SYMMI|nr:hypothetical protein AK812_SmicGene38596 [Symbiodinium microadriaticum]